MRIVRLANFVAPHSGGLRTSLAELGAGYLVAGHEPVLVIPGERDGDEPTAQGRVITLRAPRLPFAGGYRVLWRRRRLARLLAGLRPDVLEVSDRTTLRWTGAWARRHSIPAVMVSHESVTALLKLARVSPGRLRSASSRAVADWLNRRTARAYQRVICTTGWAAAEFERIGVSNLAACRSAWTWPRSPRTPGGGGEIRARYVGEGQTLLVHCGRLSAEKKPQRSLTTLATLRAEGMPVRLVVAGGGPLRTRLRRRAARAGLPVTFTGFLAGRAELAALLASADVAIAPGPAETFGLAALEALACGTPVVVSAESALPEVVGDAGASVPGEDFAAGVRALLAPAGTRPAGRGPGPRRALRLGHRRARFPRRAQRGGARDRGRGRGRGRTGAGMTRFAALGDSITVGMGDPVPGGGWRGWAALLGGTLPHAEVHNLAISGALAADMERVQLPAAAALRPDVASVVVGINDTLRGDFDPDRTGAAIGRTVAGLREAGAQVLTMRLPDPGLIRRSRDLVPALVGLAVREWLNLEDPEPERLKQTFRKLRALRAVALGSPQGAEPSIRT